MKTKYNDWILSVSFFYEGAMHRKRLRTPVLSVSTNDLQEALYSHLSTRMIIYRRWRGLSRFPPRLLIRGSNNHWHEYPEKASASPSRRTTLFWSMRVGCITCTFKKVVTSGAKQKKKSYSIFHDVIICCSLTLLWLRAFCDLVFLKIFECRENRDKNFYVYTMNIKYSQNTTHLCARTQCTENIY